MIPRGSVSDFFKIKLGLQVLSVFVSIFKSTNMIPKRAQQPRACTGVLLNPKLTAN